MKAIADLSKEEVWRPIDLDTRYKVSSKGKVMGVKGMMKNQKGSHYFHVEIAGITKLVHRLVAQAFIPNPENKSQVNHKDGNKLNNSVENLEWCTVKENTIHAFEHGLRNGDAVKGEKQWNSKLTEDQVLDIRSRKGELLKNISLEFGVSVPTISMIRNNKVWKHL